MKRQTGHWVSQAEYDLETARVLFRSRRRVELLAVKKLSCDSRLGVLGYGLKEYEHADHLTFPGEIKRTGKVIWEAEDGLGQD